MCYLIEGRLSERQSEHVVRVLEGGVATETQTGATLVYTEPHNNEAITAYLTSRGVKFGGKS